MLPKNRLLAAVDMGSNSFRMEIGRYSKGVLLRQDYVREPVRLGRGLQADSSLSLEAMERGWHCLASFKHLLQQANVSYVRAVATQTLRQATNREEFVRQGTKILGYPIEVISGEEEAHLIYLGVSYVLNATATFNTSETEKRLVVDIGGRSTEIITGQGMQPHAAQSCPVGSVALSMDFFQNNLFTTEQFDHAIAAARSHLEQALKQIQQTTGATLAWQEAYGASGTIGAISTVLKMNELSNGVITRAGLGWLYEQLLQAGSTQALEMPGLGDRKDVVGGGLAVMLALFDTFQSLRAITPARGALRQGVLYQMLQPV